MIQDARSQIRRVHVMQTNGLLKERRITSIMKPHSLSEDVILKEINNLALKDLTRSMLNILKRIQDMSIDREQAMLEIATHKQIIQLIVLDYNKMLRK